MSTFNKPTNLDPIRSEKSDEIPQDTRAAPERPSPEKVSPSQQGKFLGALEKKEKKREESVFVSEGSEEEEKVDEKGGLFGLAGYSKVKSRKSLSEKDAGGKEEEPSEEEPPAPLIAAVPQTTLPEAVISETVVPESVVPETVVPQTGKFQAIIPPTTISDTVSPRTIEPRTAHSRAAATPLPIFTSTTTEKKLSSAIQPVVEEPQNPTAITTPIAPKKPHFLEKERVAFHTDAPTTPLTQAIPIVLPTEIKAATVEAKVSSPKIDRAALIEIINQAVDAMTVVVSKASTTTTITIKQPPLFEGATLTITEFSSARKEYNITFTNLSPDARRLIESTSNEQTLRQALVDKGYTLHTITIDPLILKVSPTNIETPSSQKDERGGQTFEDTGAEDQREDKRFS